MRAGLDGVSTARYFMRNREKLNKRATVFTTMATVSERHREGEPFYVHERHVYQLLKEQKLLRLIDHYSYNETFRAYERRGQIAYDKDGDVWIWLTDPRLFSALESDHEAYRAENGYTKRYETNRAQRGRERSRQVRDVSDYEHEIEELEAHVGSLYIWLQEAIGLLHTAIGQGLLPATLRLTIEDWITRANEMMAEAEEENEKGAE